MEQIDSELEYDTSQSSDGNPDKRFNWLYILPILGVLWLVLLTLAATFQFSISEIVDPILGLMIVVFFVFIIGLFWAYAPRIHRV
ncbi:MAG: hypothetical protein E6J34_14550 [Chloroflexi bacterium]|nr:MAG: hypothetical protein E6J34_14550 [Chloroflexota bacterium]